MPKQLVVLITLLWCLFFSSGCTYSLARYEPFSLYVGQDVRLLSELNVWGVSSGIGMSYVLVTSSENRGNLELVGVLPAGEVLEIVDVRLREFLFWDYGFIAVLRFDRPQGKGEISAEYPWGNYSSLRKPPWQFVDTSIADPFAGLQDDDELYVGLKGKSYGEDVRK